MWRCCLAPDATTNCPPSSKVAPGKYLQRRVLVIISPIRLWIPYTSVAKQIIFEGILNRDWEGQIFSFSLEVKYVHLASVRRAIFTYHTDQRSRQNKYEMNWEEREVEKNEIPYREKQIRGIEKGFGELLISWFQFLLTHVTLSMTNYFFFLNQTKVNFLYF